MKVWMLSVSYLPMVINAMIIPYEELKWALPVYWIAAVGILVAMIMLKLMTWKNDNVSVLSHVSCSNDTANTSDRFSGDDLRPVSDEMLTPMPLQWAKG